MSVVLTNTYVMAGSIIPGLGLLDLHCDLFGIVPPFSSIEVRLGISCANTTNENYEAWKVNSREYADEWINLRSVYPILFTYRHSSYYFFMHFYYLFSIIIIYIYLFLNKPYIFPGVTIILCKPARNTWWLSHLMPSFLTYSEWMPLVHGC